MDLDFYGRLHPARPGMTYATFTAITSRVNLNGDAWPVGELADAYRSFIGCPLFVEHEAERAERARGAVIDAELVGYSSTMDRDVLDPSVRVDVLVEIDAQAFPFLASEVASGGLDSVSMGADVAETVCSVCGNVARGLGELCSHVARKDLDPSVFETCRGVVFRELSVVFDPADPRALASAVAGFDAAGRRTAADRALPVTNWVRRDPVDVEGVSFVTEEEEELNSKLFEDDPYLEIEV